MVKSRKKAKAVEAPTLRNKKRSQWRDVWIRLCRNKLAMVAMVVVLLLVLVAVFADFVTPYAYDAIDPVNAMQYPSLAHPLGTDNFGRDILSRVIYGGRISLLVAVMAVAIALISGSLLGATAAYFGGIYESIIMRAMDIVMAIPGFLLAVSISTSLGGGVWQTALAISIGAIPSYARIMRATVLTIKDQEYVEAARATGASDLRIILKHIVPNTLSPIIVESTLRIGACIMQISSLSFIGLGVQPPTPEWGSIMSDGQEFITTFWPMITFPGIAIMLTVFAFNVMGDGLRDALDPRLKQ